MTRTRTGPFNLEHKETFSYTPGTRKKHLDLFKSIPPRKNNGHASKIVVFAEKLNFRR
jgi:hypothetical protein